MNVEIKKFELIKARLLIDLPPVEWNFNIVEFVNYFFKQPFFYSFSISYKRTIIGFGNVFLFDKLAWLGNIIIEESYRNRGLGTRMTKYLMDFSMANNAESLILIATKLGEPIYKKLGFKVDSNYLFYNVHTIKKSTVDNEIIRLTDNNEKKQIYKLDNSVTGENRTDLLKQFEGKTYTCSPKNGKFNTYFILDLGNGLIVSTEKKEGEACLQYLINQGKSNIVVPEANIIAQNVLRESGFVLNNSAPRMHFGNPILWHPENIFSRGSGFCG